VANLRSPAATPAPHSWDLEHWPTTVYPHTPGKGRYLVRSHRTSLVAAGALTRVGRDLVVIGAPFSKWLDSQAKRVAAYEIAPNAKRQAATLSAT
jgi:hypothetical protein